MSSIDLDWLCEWTFKEKGDVLSAHKIHRYPAVFIPELADKIIEAFSAEGDTVLDLFSGSGTALLESMKLKRHSKGIELNPLAVMITKVKTQYIESDRLSQGIADWQKSFLSNTFAESKLTRKDFWFHEITSRSVSDAIGAMDAIEDEHVSNFLKICLSEIIREVSYCVHSGFKNHRDKKKMSCELSFSKDELLLKINPVIKRNAAAVAQLKDIDDATYKPTIYFHDSKVKVDAIEDGSVDLILTSPPYGDSDTTVAYGQFSTFSSELLQLKNLSAKPARRLDDDLLGGYTKDVDVEKLCKKSLTVKNIQELFLGRAMLAPTESERNRSIERLKDILAFYIDLDMCLKNGAEYLKKDGFFVLITASRIVHDTKLHTDNIIAELSRHYGLSLKNIYNRDIYKKRMPVKVNASNVSGEISITMTEESVIVLQKY